MVPLGSPSVTVPCSSQRVYCGHEYTINNLKFARHVEPNNTSIQEKLAWAKVSCSSFPWTQSLAEEMEERRKCWGDVEGVKSQELQDAVFQGNGVWLCPEKAVCCWGRRSLPGNSLFCTGHSLFPRIPGGAALSPSFQAQYDSGEPTIPSTIAEEFTYNPFMRVR